MSDGPADRLPGAAGDEPHGFFGTERSGPRREIDPEVWTLIDTFLEERGGRREPLIPLLHRVQESLGHVPHEVQEYVADRLGLSPVQVYGVVSFYHRFTTTPRARYRIEVCTGTGCAVFRSEELLAVIEEACAVRAGGISEDGLFNLVPVRCIGSCDRAPAVLVNGELHGPLTPDAARRLVSRLREDARSGVEVTQAPPRAVTAGSIPFAHPQVRRTLSRCGQADPEKIDDCLRRGGYQGLQRALREMRPEEVIEEVKRSGLQGRGGAGFPAGMKWQLVADAEGGDRFVVCNGDEGDPGAFADRSIMEGDPHAVIEGLCLAGYAVGARRGFLYVRAEYELAVRRLRIALEQARERGFLGRAFDFDIRLVEGAGAFVCGEETALLRSIEGRRGMPNPRPPYPAQRGLWGRPTLINNVETLASVPRLIARGAAEFSDVGTALSKGTKVFSLTGRVERVGLIEVPLGITLREIVFEIGGGIRQGAEFKAAQMGGPSGGFLAAAHLDTPLDYRSIQELGAMMGSGGLVILDETVCVVRMARFFMEFCVEESCGKCPPCRIGTRAMLDILRRITEGRGRTGDIERLQTLGEHMRATSLCGLGQTAPNPTLSSIRHFRAEYEAHILENVCPAGDCRSRTGSRPSPPIDPPAGRRPE